MTYLIALILMLIGFVGMFVMIKKRMPALAQLSYTKNSIKINPKFSLKRIIRSILLSFRNLILRTERKTTKLLFKLHNESNESKFSEDFWRKVKRKK